MANCCMYTIKATGKMEDVKEFVRMLKWKGTPPNEGFGRIMSAYVSCEEPLEGGLFSLNRKYRQQKGKEKYPSVIKWVKQNGIDCMLNHEASASEESKFI